MNDTAYIISIDSPVDDDAKTIIAVATSEESRDRLLSHVQFCIDMLNKLSPIDSKNRMKFRELTIQSYEKFKNPVPVAVPVNKRRLKKSTTELMEYRKDQLEKGNIEQANAILNEIKEINEYNRILGIINKGYTEEFQAKCVEVGRQRDEYITSNMEESEFELMRIISNFPLTATTVYCQEIKLDTFFNHPQLNEEFMMSMKKYVQENF